MPRPVQILITEYEQLCNYWSPDVFVIDSGATRRCSLRLHAIFPDRLQTVFWDMLQQHVLLLLLLLSSITNAFIVIIIPRSTVITVIHGHGARDERQPRTRIAQAGQEETSNSSLSSSRSLWSSGARRGTATPVRR